METITVYNTDPQTHSLEQSGTVSAMLVPGYRPDQPTLTADGERVAYTVYVRAKWQEEDPRHLIRRGSFLTIRGKKWRVSHEPEEYANTGGAFCGLLVQIDEEDAWSK